jgi:hypothetical protein
MRYAWGTALLALFFTGGSTVTVACSPCSVRGQDPIDFTSGITNESRTVYQTGAPDDEMLHFPQGRTYNLVHGLGTVPVGIELFVSFREQLERSGDTEDKTEPNNVSPSAGNQTVIQVWDDEFIQVRNDTCAELYLRAVIIADPDEVVSGNLGGAAGAPGTED